MSVPGQTGKAMNSSDGRGKVHELPTDRVIGRYVPVVRTILARRKARRELLPQGMLVDVAWDLLLQIFLFRASPGAATTDSIAIMVGQSPTVTARWLSLLQSDGLVTFREHGDPPAWELTTPFLNRLLAYLREHYRSEL